MNLKKGVKMSKKLEGKVAVVTGGARGIGKAICDRLAEEGAKLAIADIMLDVAEATAAEYRTKGIVAEAFKVNVAVAQECDEMVKAIVEKLGGIDILVNNAGLTRDGLMVRMSEQDWDLVIDVNLKGTFNLTKASFKPLSRSGNGKIVNVASVVGRMGNAGQANYSASKAGVIGLTKTTAKEFASRNITCNAVAPGYIQTDMTGKLSDAARDAFLNVIPLKRGGTPKDVADVVYFLASPDSDYVTGQVINVCGGMLM